jgi:hypothetical protein
MTEQLAIDVVFKNTNETADRTKMDQLLTCFVSSALTRVTRSNQPGSCCRIAREKDRENFNFVFHEVLHELMYTIRGTEADSTTLNVTNAQLLQRISHQAKTITKLQTALTALAVPITAAAAPTAVPTATP